MSLESFPPELIHSIASLLPAPQIERLAKTYNKRIYQICKPLLAARLAARRNASAMLKQFNCSTWVGGTYIQSHYDYAKLNEKYGPFLPTPNPNFDYLDLKGDLQWLKPQDPRTAMEWLRYYGGCAATAPQIEKLSRDADRLGIAFPEGFEKFFLDEELQKRIFSMSASYFVLGESFYKCPKSVDGGAGGYIIQIYSDQQGCYYWGLYLAPGEEKNHCVLGMPWCIELDDEELDEQDETGNDGEYTEEEVKAAKGLGVRMANVRHGDVVLDTPSFEEFLVKIYYEEWCNLLHMQKRELTDRQKEYVLNLSSNSSSK